LKKALQAMSGTTTHLPIARASAVVVATTSLVLGFMNTCRGGRGVQAGVGVGVRLCHLQVGAEVFGGGGGSDDVTGAGVYEDLQGRGKCAGRFR
jgi:hypothetical protein